MRTCMVFLGALLLVLGTGSPAASAAGQTTAYVYHGNSELAVAIFSQTVNGITTYVLVTAGDGEFHALAGGAPGSLSSAQVSVYQYYADCPPWFEGCSLLLYAQGHTETPEVMVENNLASGLVRATLTATDTTGGVIPVTIDLTWTGLGQVTHNQGSTRFKQDGFTTITTGVDRGRNATLEGALYINGVNLLTDATSTAYLERNAGTTVTVEFSY